MNNELINFHHEMFGDIRAIERDGEPWFVGKDVAVALGYSNARDALAKHVDNEDKKILTSQNATLEKLNIPNRGLTIINESGLYSLVLCSKLPSAKKFKHWVTAEVLPSIRRHGAYATAPTIEKIIASPEFGIALLKNLQQEQNMRREAEQRVRKLKPLADYTALILACPETVSVSQVAQDYGMSAVAFNRILNRAVFDRLADTFTSHDILALKTDITDSTARNIMRRWHEAGWVVPVPRQKGEKSRKYKKTKAQPSQCRTVAPSHL